MDDATRKRLAASLGLAETATESQINERLQHRALAANPATGAEGGEPDSAGTPASEVTPEMEPPSDQTSAYPSGTAPSVPTEEETPPEESAPEETQAGFVKLDAETYKRLRAGAEAGLRLEESGKNDRQTAKVEAAIKSGKIPSVRRGHYLKLMAMDEAGTTTQLDELAPGLVPIIEVGTTGNTAEGDITAGQNEGLPDAWFPGLAQRKNAVAAGTSRVVNAREG